MKTRLMGLENNGGTMEGRTKMTEFTAEPEYLNVMT